MGILNYVGRLIGYMDNDEILVSTPSDGSATYDPEDCEVDEWAVYYGENNDEQEED